MKEIPLTQSKVALIDDEDYKRLSEYKWKYDNYNNYAERTVRIPGSLQFKHISMAQEVLQFYGLIDHKDHNGLNYQKLNLRKCTTSQNGQNRRKQKGKVSSKYKGVYAEKKRKKKWRANIILRDIFGQQYRKTLGHFSVEEEAAKAYDEAARFYFKEFAALNFPRKGEQGCL